ncbi:MAG: hypothetical protein LUQ31_05010 [Methanoregula sp.]|nr:hypothetical protein [Methanoregula sp.]
MKRMKIGVMLLALLLAAMAMVPMVSAEDYLCQGNINCTTADTLINVNSSVSNGPSHEPIIFDDLLVKGSDASANSVQRTEEFLFLEIPTTVLSKSSTETDNGMVSITVPTVSLQYVEERTGTPAPVPENLLSKNSSIQGAVTVLWAPKAILTISSSGSSTTIQVPERILLKFDTHNESVAAIKKSANENLQIKHDSYPAGVTSKSLLQATTSQDFAERSWYYDANCAHQVTGAQGVIEPSSSYNNGESYFSYHEIEIYLERDTDCIEFVSYHRTDGQKRIFVSMHDDGVLSTPIDIDATNLPYMNYYLSIDSPYYSTRLQNPLTGTWYTNSWNDSNDFSRYIKSLRGSTELLSLQHVPPIYSFHTATNPITVDSVRNSATGTWVLPNQDFTDMGMDTSQSYVHGTKSWNNGRIVTTHECGSTVS